MTVLDGVLQYALTFMRGEEAVVALRQLNAAINATNLHIGWNK